jgi:hypothetical protein
VLLLHYRLCDDADGMGIMVRDYSWWEPLISLFILVCVAWFVISTATDAWRRLTGVFRRNEINFIEYEVFVEDHRPNRHPDPTRPSDDEWPVVEITRRGRRK